MFSPESIPNVVHLALNTAGGANFALVGILPQIRTLVLSLHRYRCCKPDDRVATVLSRTSSLEHLALHVVHGIVPHLDGLGFELQLQSLHLPISALKQHNHCNYDNVSKNWLDSVAEGRRPSYEIQKIVLYGRKEERMSRFWPRFNWDLYGSRQEPKLPSFENFDGM